MARLRKTKKAPQADPRADAKEAVQDLNDRLEEIKQEDDLGKLAQMFDGMADAADKMAARLTEADNEAQEAADKPDKKDAKPDTEAEEGEAEQSSLPNLPTNVPGSVVLGTLGVLAGLGLFGAAKLLSGRMSKEES
jgi:hypothetical protein